MISRKKVSILINQKIIIFICIYIGTAYVIDKIFQSFSKDTFIEEKKNIFHHLSKFFNKHKDVFELFNDRLVSEVNKLQLDGSFIRNRKASIMIIVICFVLRFPNIMKNSENRINIFTFKIIKILHDLSKSYTENDMQLYVPYFYSSFILAFDDVCTFFYFFLKNY